MWGITVYLMRLADYLQGRKDKKTSRECNYIAKNENALTNHMHKEHGLQIKDCKLKNCKISNNDYLNRSPYQF